MEVTGLAKFDAMHQAIVEVQSIDEAKEIIDQAEALRVYAKQINLTFDQQQRISEIKLRAQRRAGEITSSLDTAQGVRTDLTYPTAVDKLTKKKQLESAGINQESARRWEQIAAIPEDDFEQLIEDKKTKGEEITTRAAIDLSKKKKKEERRKEKEKRQAVEDVHIEEALDSYQLYHCSVSGLVEFVEPSSVDAIITDPPYPVEYLPVYSELADFADYSLKEGGSLVVMCGQSYMPDIFIRLTERLNYQWMLSYVTPGGQSPQIWNRKVNTFWKPLLWFVKGTYGGDWIGDVITCKPNDNDKGFHYWGQNEYGIKEIVDRFTLPGSLVVDPFLGGGTTGVVSLATGRKFVGCDVDAGCIVKSDRRLRDGFAG